MRKTSFKLAAISIVLFVTERHVAAQAQKPKPPQATQAFSSEWQRVLKALKSAKPIPPPTHPLLSVTKTAHGNLVRFNPQTGQESTLNAPDAVAVPGRQREEGNKGLKPVPGTGAAPANLLAINPPGTSEAVANIQNQNIFAATAPGPLYYPYSFPWNTIGRILGRWNVNGTDYYWLCSASTASDFHMISAGHCVYNHDPIGDNSGVGAGFANEMWAWTAETDVIDPIDHSAWPDFPYGVAKATWFTTYNSWINSSDLNWDFSFITLDRRLGDHVGWMGREWGVQASALNFDGYPAQAPYVPSDNPFQYPGFDANNVSGYTCCRIQMSAYTYGGHSGGPVWRYDGTNDYVQGVNSTSNRVGYAEATLLTGQIDTDLKNTIAADQSARPPANLAQLIEYVFDGSSKGLGQTSALIGFPFSMTLNAFNAGYADAGDTTAEVYLTTNPDSVTSGRYVGTYDFGYLGTYSYSVQNAQINLPTSITPGTYYVGYVLSGANPQYYTDNNAVIITNQTLTTYCNADAYETDNSSSQASTLTSGSIQNHTICNKNDADWATFTLTQSSAVSLTTAGYSGGDTTMTLYDANLSQVAYNDDNGIDYYSVISQTCGTNPLPPGKYYVLIQSYANATIIPNYTLSLNAAACPVSTATALASSLNPSVYSQNVTFTATVTSGSGTPAGTVTFTTGTTTLGTRTLSGGSASINVSTLSGGSHSVTATYMPNSPFVSSTSNIVMQTVKKATSSTSISSSHNPAAFGASVTFTATVASSAGTPGGSVTFMDGATTLGTQALSSGQASFSTSTLAPGTHSVTAVYSGGNNYKTSTSAALSQTVTKASTASTVTSSLNPSTQGSAVTFTAKVKSTTSGTPTGQVKFKNGSTTLGTGTLSSGKASFTTSTLSSGSHSITVVYAGDSNFTASTSPVLAQKVN